MIKLKKLHLLGQENNMELRYLFSMQLTLVWSLENYMIFLGVIPEHYQICLIQPHQKIVKKEEEKEKGDEDNNIIITIKRRR